MTVPYKVAKGTKRSAFDRNLGFEKHFAAFDEEFEDDVLAKRVIEDLRRRPNAEVIYLGRGSFGVAFGLLGRTQYAVKIVSGETDDSEGLLGTWLNPAYWETGIELGRDKIPPRREGLSLIGKNSDPLLNVLDYRGVGVLSYGDATVLVDLIVEKLADLEAAAAGIETLKNNLARRDPEKPEEPVGHVFELELADGDATKIFDVDDALVLVENVRSLLFQIMTTLRKLNDFSGFVHGDLTLKNVFYFPYETVGRSSPALTYRHGATEHRIKTDDGGKLLVYMLADFGLSSLSNRDAIDTLGRKYEGIAVGDFSAFSPIPAPSDFVRNHGADLHLLGTRIVLRLTNAVLEREGLRNLSDANAGLVAIFRFCVERLFYSWSSLKSGHFRPISEPKRKYEVDFNATLRRLGERALEKKTAEEMARVFSASYEDLQLLIEPKEATSDAKLPLEDVYYLPAKAYDSVSKNATYQFWTDPLFKPYEIPKEKKRSEPAEKEKKLSTKIKKIGPAKTVKRSLQLRGDPNVRVRTFLSQRPDFFSPTAFTW